MGDYVACEDCGTLVPEDNLAMHQVNSCGGRARAALAPPQPTPPREDNRRRITVSKRQRQQNRAQQTQASQNVVDLTSSPSPQRKISASAAGRKQNTIASPRQSSISSTRRSQANVATVAASDSRRPCSSDGRRPQASVAAAHTSVARHPPASVAASAPAARQHATASKTSSQNTNAANSSGNPPLVDLSNHAPSPEQSWTCSRCTLSNPNLLTRCEACQAPNPNRTPDASSRRERGTSSASGGAELLAALLSNSHRASISSSGRGRSAHAIGQPMYPSGSNRRDNRRTSRRSSAQQPRASFRIPPGMTATSDPMLNMMLMGLMGRAHGASQNIDGMSYEELLRTFGDGSENLGANELEISALPSQKLKNVEKELPKDNRECIICLDEFKEGDLRKTLPCLHGFHEDCIEKALRNKGCCPICQHSIKAE